MTTAYASKKLRDNRDIVLAAVREDGHAIKFASPRLKRDKEIMTVSEKQIESRT